MADIFGESSGDDDEEIVPAAPYPPATQMRSRHWRSITLHVTDTQRVTFPALTFDSAAILRYDSVGNRWWVNVKELMLIPRTVREVERCLLLSGLAVLAPYCPQACPLSFRRVLSLSPSRVYKNEGLCLLARLVGTGSLGKATVAHVLTMLGGPMERMESWVRPEETSAGPAR